MRVGQGFDVHAFEDGRPLVVGGVTIPDHAGLAGDSDADVLTHAITDALLGAAALGDLGSHFPAPDYAGASSIAMLQEAMGKVRAAGFEVVNVDATVVAESPRMSPHVAGMRAALAAALEVDEMQVSVKSTSTDGLGFTGRGEGMAAFAAVLVSP